MRKLIIILLACIGLGAANQADYLFQQGNEAYKNNQYSEAITHYESILRMGKTSASVYYNLGNAYYKNNQLGKAIVNYERALLLAPHDGDIEFNLHIAQLRIVDKIAAPEFDYIFKVWQSIKYTLSLNQWMLSLFFLMILITLLIILQWFIKNRGVQNIVRQVLAPLAGIFIFGIFLFGIRVREDISIKNAVILEQKVNVVSEPAANATEVFALHEGVKVRIIDRSGNFVRIRLSDGKDGWLPASALEII